MRYGGGNVAAASGGGGRVTTERQPDLLGYARTLTRITFFGSLGGGFLFGYDAGVMGSALLFIRDELGTGPWTEGMIVSLTSAGALVGAALGGASSDRFGRKLVVFACDALYFVGACMMAFAPDITTLCLGRALAGVAMGASSVNIPMYLSELAPDRVRGTMTAANTFVVDLGQLASYAVGAALASSGHWRFMLGLLVVPAAVQSMGMLWMPESPAWLLKKGLRRGGPGGEPRHFTLLYTAPLLLGLRRGGRGASHVTSHRFTLLHSSSLHIFNSRPHHH